MFDFSKSRTDVKELLSHAEPEPSAEPLDRHLDMVDIMLCPTEDRILALEDVEVSMATLCECELDLLNAEMTDWQEGRDERG